MSKTCHELVKKPGQIRYQLKDFFYRNNHLYSKPAFYQVSTRLSTNFLSKASQKHAQNKTATNRKHTSDLLDWWNIAMRWNYDTNGVFRDVHFNDWNLVWNQQNNEHGYLNVRCRLSRLKCCLTSTWNTHSYFNGVDFNVDQWLDYGRETARSLILFRLTFSVIRKIMHKIEFLGHPMGHQSNISALSESFNTQKLCSRVSSKEYQFYS